MRNCVRPLVENMFSLLEKIDFTAKKMYWEKKLLQLKIYVSTSGIYVTTTKNNIFYRQKYVFPLVGIMFALLREKVLQSRFVSTIVK